MISIPMTEIEQSARQLRAEEIRRIERQMAGALYHQIQRAGVALRAGLQLLSAALRPLFSWNPQRRALAHKI